MKNGLYLSTYIYINKLAYHTKIELRHDMNISLWRKEDNKISLLHYWELERETGLKQHRRAFYSIEHAENVINSLLHELDLSLEDIDGIWGTPELDTCFDYSSMHELSGFCYHSVCHLFSSLMMNTRFFNNETILAFAVDGVPDNLVDKHISDKYYYTACISNNGKILKIFPAYSPGVHWGVVRDYYQMQEGSLMALASASTSSLLKPKLKLVLVEGKEQVAVAVDDIYELINYVEALRPEDEGELFNGFDMRFSFAENKISMVAKELQRISMEIMDKNIERAMQQYEIELQNTYLALSGGFCLNCPTNTYLMQKYKFKGFIAPPCVNDSGISMGMALYYFYKKCGSKLEFYFDKASNGDQDNSIISKIKKYYKYIDSVTTFNERQIVKDIVDAPIIWFEGRSEIGPRALGNRSLLADPRKYKTKDILNEIKQRQWWRPVAPIVLEEDIKEWFEDAFESKYMLHTFCIKNEKRSFVPAIVHEDGSARVQTVNPKDNPELYSLLCAFKKETGIPILCNTSLNDKGEPIINTVEEMINFALRKNIKVAYVNKLRIKFKNHNQFEEINWAKRKIDFDIYEEMREKDILYLNPNNIAGESLMVFLQNPELYDKIDLRDKKSVKMLERLVQIRKNKFHIL